MAIDEQFVRVLVEAPDPLGVIWREMERVCAVDAFPANLRGHYDECERGLNELERALYESYFDVYDELLERARAQDGKYVLSLFDSAPFVVVADSLSVREIGLLQAKWAALEWSVERVGFAVAPFPPVTASLCRMILGTDAPASARDTSAFRFRYVAGPQQIPPLPKNERLLVWLRLPDTALEEVTVAQTHTVAEAFEKTVETLERVLDASGRREAFITSDHGYVYAREAYHFIPMMRGVEGAAREVFSRGSRVQAATPENAQKLKDYEPREKEMRHFVFTNQHVAIRGRYWWGSPNPNDRCTAHGGLSFVECLVPILKVKTSPAGDESPASSRAKPDESG